ncbi:unnamed protein product [Caenorhabditis bovis]|uniref:Apple domain-containing protein n=1 Tax=Caenorhabditis bovis TaxID=2654633 RepID=A0A8S1EMX6_9PELO|nr:unnamed protein product [Caenorhabditis bovis]
MNRRFLLLCFFTISEASLQCFNVIPSNAISNSDPIAELFHVTAGECLNYCIQQSAQKGDGCVSVVFHRNFNTCQLYGHDGTLDDAQLVYLEEHELYIRSSWEGPCQDKEVPKRGYQQQPARYVAPSQQRITVSPHDYVPPNNNNQNTNNNFFVVPKSQPLSNVDLPKIDVNSIREGVRKSPQNFESAIIKEMDELESEDYFVQTTTAKTLRKPNSMTTFKNPTRGYKCPNKQDVLSYFIVYGARMFTKSVPQRLNGVDQSSCAMYCSQNINAIGNNIPCYSFNYEGANEICEMYNKQDELHWSWASLAIDQDYVFADKFCINTKKDCPAETNYPVHLYRQINRNIIRKIAGLNSKVACLAECIDNEDCKAVTYKSALCVLHNSSPSDDPRILSEGTEKTMVIENGCYVQLKTDEDLTTKVKEQSSDSWQEWSLCQFGVKGRKMRVRTRECDECEDNLQMEEC